MRLAQFIGDHQVGLAPAEAYRLAKMALLDCTGVALAALHEPTVAILRDAVMEAPQAPEATVWGTGHRVGVLEAALVNGAAAHALDYDDLNRSIQGHPSVVVAPAVLAAAQRVGASGQQVLDAYLVGFEVMAKLGQVLNPGMYLKGWHPTSVLGVMGACAGASHLLGLTGEQVIHALGVAASEASGIKKNFGSMTKPLHAGSAARKGMWAALLAQRGLTADPEALDGAFGYLELFRGDTPFNLEPLKHLGDPFDIVASGLAFKQYPCCGSTHPVLDCVLDIRQRYEPDVARVTAVDCFVNPQRLGHINRPTVSTPLQAKFSLQCVAAMALLDGYVGLGQFSGPAYLRPAVQELMRKVRLVPDVSLGEFAARAVVHLADGRLLVSQVPEAKGSPTYPMGDDDLLRKFVDCASGVAGEERARQAADVMLHLEREPGVERYLALLAPEKA